MKKFMTIGIAVIFTLFSFISCGEKTFAPVAGKAKAEDMLRLIPKDMVAVFFLDIHRILTIEFVDKFIQENLNKELFQKFTDYQNFVETTGIDPQKDIYFIVAAVREMEKEEKEGVGIINLKYNKDALLSIIKEKAAEEEKTEFIEEEYNGFAIYTIKEKDEEGSFAFLDESNIAAGNKNEVKSIINILQKKEENILSNEIFAPLLAQTNKKAMFWGAIAVPPEATSKLMAKNPMLSVLEAISGASLHLDYKNKNVIVEINFMSSDEIKNQEMADSLNQFKSLGAMIQIQDLNMGEILDRIEITSGPDYVKIYARFPEDLPKNIIDKLKMEKKTEEKEKIK